MNGMLKREMELQLNGGEKMEMGAWLAVLFISQVLLIILSPALPRVLRKVPHSINSDVDNG